MKRFDKVVMRPARFRESDRVAGFAPLDFAVDVATSAVDKTVDITSSVWDAIPGHKVIDDVTGELTGPVEDFVNGPFKDFANTGLGEVIMRAVSVAVSMTAIWMSMATGSFVLGWVGSTIAFIAWSIPGLAKGEPFDEALIKEFAYRVAYVVGIFSKEAGDAVAKQLGPMMSDQLKKGLDEGMKIVKKNFPGVDTKEMLRQLGITPESVLKNMGLTPKQLAAKLGIREDVAAMAIAWLRRDPAYFDQIKKWYDPKTGVDMKDAFYAEQKRKVRLEVVDRLMKLSTTDPCYAYSEAVRLGEPDTAAVLKPYCEQRRMQDTTLVNLAAKSPCLAYTEAVRQGRSNPAEILKKRCEALKKSGVVDANQAMMGPESNTFAKASSLKIALIVGTVLTVGGIAWFKLRRGK